MTAQWTIVGVAAALTALFKTAGTPEDVEIFLFSNNKAIDDATTNADLTEIDNTNGCGKQDLTKALFDAATSADPSVLRYNGATGVSWSVTGAETIYGYAIRGKTSDTIYGAENFGIKSVENGNTLTIAPLDIKLDIPE